MELKKSNLIMILANLIICISSIIIAKNIIKPSYANSSDDTKLAFNEKKLENKFDVSDFSGTDIKNIDIVNKEYIPNQLTVLDSQFKINEDTLNKFYQIVNSYGAGTSFYIVSLTDGMSIGYNVDKAFETASSIKAPYALYIYKEITKGNIDGNSKMAYQPQYYNKGTGIIKNSDFGTEYTIKQLVYYSLTESDNIAHQMLHKNFGVKGYNDMLSSLGCKQLYLTSGNPWGFTSARSAALVWQDIFNFSLNDETGIEFLNILSNGKYNYFKEVMPSTPSASKTGFASKDVVETGIVFDKTPYIGIAIANKGGNIGAYTEVLKLVSVMNEIMNEYNTYKEIA